MTAVTARRDARARSAKRRQDRCRGVALLRLPHVHGDPVAAARSLGRSTRRCGRSRDTQAHGYISLPRRADPRQLPQRLERRREFALHFAEHPDRVDPRRDRDLARGVHDRVRGVPIQLAAQPGGAVDLHRRQPVAAAGASSFRCSRSTTRSCGVPEPLSDNGLLYDQYFGIFLINVVFQVGFCVLVLSNYMKTLSHELTEAALVDGASVLRIWRGGGHAALPPGARRARDSRVHLHLQRLLLGPAPPEDGRSTADHVGAQQSAGAILHEHQPARGRRPAGRRPDDPRVPRAPAPLHQRPLARRRPRADQDRGRARRQRPDQPTAASRQTASSTKRRARKSPSVCRLEPVDVERQPGGHQLGAAALAVVGSCDAVVAGRAKPHTR